MKVNITYFPEKRLSPTQLYIHQRMRVFLLLAYVLGASNSVGLMLGIQMSLPIHQFNPWVYEFALSGLVWQYVIDTYRLNIQINSIGTQLILISSTITVAIASIAFIYLLTILKVNSQFP
jgi:hypothetical protein